MQRWRQVHKLQRLVVAIAEYQAYKAVWQSCIGQCLVKAEPKMHSSQVAWQSRANQALVETLAKIQAVKVVR